MLIVIFPNTHANGHPVMLDEVWVWMKARGGPFYITQWHCVSVWHDRWIIEYQP